MHSNAVVDPVTYPPTNITPVSDENFALNEFTYPMPGVFTGSSGRNGFRRVTFDTTTNRLYIATYTGSVSNILVYQLRGSSSATCSDGIQNQGETGIDCGGPCTPCGGTDAIRPSAPTDLRVE